MELIDLGKKNLKSQSSLWFIRHGRTVHNQANDIACFAGKRIDSALSSEGISQTKELAKKLIDLIKFDLILTSSMLRAQQTGKIITEKYAEAGIVIDQQIIDDFEEIDVGDFTGLTTKEAHRLDPQAAKAFYDADFDHLAFPNGENTEQLKIRSKRVQKKLESLSTKKILLIGHGMFNRFILWSISSNQTNLWQERDYPHDRVIILNEI